MVQSNQALSKRIHNFLQRKDSQYPDLGRNLQDIPLRDITKPIPKPEPYLP